MKLASDRKLEALNVILTSTHLTDQHKVIIGIMMKDPGQTYSSMGMALLTGRREVTIEQPMRKLVKMGWLAKTKKYGGKFRLGEKVMHIFETGQEGDW